MRCSKDNLALERVIRDVRARFPENPVVVVGDNFHHYDFSGSRQYPGEARQRASRICEGDRHRQPGRGDHDHRQAIVTVLIK